MGKSTERYRSYIGQQAAQSTSAAAERSRLANERTLRQQEQLLGTDAQLSGNLTDISEEELPYLGSYSLDAGYAANLAGSHEKAGDIKHIMEMNVQEANQIMAQARSAAAAGDLEKAEQLKLEAEGRL